jgi:hypothetical protein
VKCEGIRYCSGAAQTNPCDRNAQCISKHSGRSFECSVSKYEFLSQVFSAFSTVDSNVHIYWATMPFHSLASFDYDY